MEQKQNRLFSPVVMLSVASQVLVILVTIGVIDAGQSDVIKSVIVSLLELLTVFGVLNNPTNPSGF